MADQKISAMPSAATLTGAELVPLVQSGANVQVTTSNLVSQILDVNGIPWSEVSSAPYLQVATTAVSTIALTTTPVLMKPTTIVGTATNMSYDSATGEITFTNAGIYKFSISVNAEASNSGQYVYWYAENNTGAGWNVIGNSGKAFVLTNNYRTQVFAANVARRAAGEKVRYWVYSNGSNVNLNTTALPSTTAIVPAIRFQIGG